MKEPRYDEHDTFDACVKCSFIASVVTVDIYGCTGLLGDGDRIRQYFVVEPRRHHRVPASELENSIWNLVIKEALKRDERFDDPSVSPNARKKLKEIGA